jgi:hypothetical protein
MYEARRALYGPRLSGPGTLSERAGVLDFKILTFKLPPLPGSP